METHEITIMVQSNIDPSQLLDIVIDLAGELESDLESYGYDSVVHSEEVSVETKGQTEGGTHV